MLRSIICSAASREVRVDVGDGVAGHADLVAAQVGVERRVEDALLGDLPGEDTTRLDLLRVERSSSAVW